MKSNLLYRFIGVLWVTATAWAGNWPAWRGPEGNGVALDKNLPLKWSDKENVRWRIELPGPGNSSPIVWDNRVFVSQYVEKDNRRTLMCVDRGTGKLLWQSGVTATDNEPTQENNPYCAGTPATDGERVYVCFGSPGVFAYDLEGKEVWRRDLGGLRHMFGTAVSPLVHGDLCYINFGPGEKTRLIALNKKTGEPAWETEPPKPEESERQAEMRGGRGGPDGARGPGGRGGFGPGLMLAPQIISQADKNGDEQATQEELSALADAWFDKLDTQHSGKLTQEEFADKLGSVLGAPPGGGGGPGGPGGPGGRGGRGGGPGRFIGPGLFAAADTNKDGTLTRSELKATFEKWATDFDSDKSGTLSEEELREGLNAALPRPNFGGPGGGRGLGGRGGSGGGGEMGGSWSTPIIFQADNHEELVVPFPFRLAAFDPKTGQQLWFSKGLGGTIYSTPVWNQGKVVAASGGPAGGSAIAVRAEGSGNITDSGRVWKLNRTKSAFGSGVIHEGYLYTISQDGIAECSDLGTGKSVWQERLSGPGAQTSSWSSMLLADGKIYVPNKSGDVFVLRASPKFEVLATNSVNEPTNASLAASNGELFLRTDKALWCLGKAM
jgi:outer membrane protein assembly factor BamB